MPIKKDNTNVAPVYREQVFIPATGAMKVMQDARPKFQGLPIASGAVKIVSPEFDLFTGVRGIANLPKGFLKTKGFSMADNLYYRQAARKDKPLEDAIKTGVIRAKSTEKKQFITKSGRTFTFGKTFKVPFFSKGKLWFDYDTKLDVIVGKDNPLLDWKTINQNGAVVKPSEINIRRTPYYMNVDNQAPTELFELYRHYPGLGYRNVTHGFPTVPITGLNTAAEQMKCGGRRKAQLGLDIREGGMAIPINKNMYYMQGRSHDEGGIGIGPNNKNGLEVEGGEVVKVDKGNIKVFSSVPFLRGVSPAQLVIGGANPDTVFKAQENFKDKNRINDDGTRYEIGGEKRIYTPNKSIQRQIQKTGKITIGGAPTISGLRTFSYLRGLTNARKYGAKGSLIFRIGKELIKKSTQKLVDNGKITKEVAQVPRSIYSQFIGKDGQNLPKTVNLVINKDKKEFGGRIKAHFGLKAPIEGGYYPESSEPQTIKWLSDWLNGRREQLYENTVSSPSHNFYYTKPFDEIRGLFKGISGNRLQTNRVFYSLINNAASATHKIGNTVSSTASGQYDKKANEITYPNSNIDMNSSIHERTHAMKSKPQTVKIKSILGDRYKQPWGKPDPNSITYPLVKYMNQYLSDPEEIYSRMMEYRYNSNLKPSDKVDVNQLNKNRELLKNLNLHYMSDEDLINLFNNVASNKNNKIKAKFGGNMIYTINGNVKNGLMSLRPKAEWGKEKKINSTTKIGTDGLIYTWAPDGEWYTDGTKYEDSKYYMREKSVLTEGKRSDGSTVKSKQKTQSLDEVVVTATRPKKKEETASKKETINLNQSNTDNKDISDSRPQYYAEKRLPMFEVNPELERFDFRYGWSHGKNNNNKVNINISDRFKIKPSFSFTDSTPRKRGNTATTITNNNKLDYGLNDAHKDTPKKESSNPKLTYTRPSLAEVSKQHPVTELPKHDTKGTNNDVEERWVGQYNPTSVKDWIGLGTNVIGSLASYFNTKKTINKTPMPIKPINTPIVHY